SCIEAGVGAVMTAHLAVPALDASGLPATLSRIVMTDLLRHAMGFEGLVVTDALIMGGITGEYPEAEAVAAALNAGCDVLLMPRNPLEAQKAILTAVDRGLVPEQRLLEAFGRMQAARRRLGLFENRSQADMASLDLEVHRQFACQTGERALTLVRGEDLLPIEQSAFVVIVNDDQDPVMERYAPGSELDPAALPWPLAHELSRRRIDWAMAYPQMPSAERQALLARARQASTVVVALFALVKAWKDRSDLSDEMSGLVRELCRGSRPAFALSFNSPYLLAQFPEVAGYACAYGPFDFIQRAAVRAMAGEIPFGGRLPVQLAF
ncbi:MAG: hypothetical protein KGR26_10825, partial [Cyanobacteria bacterium REEB65]|nr:hypothetical protein [Cyanobacteria bacterium REEB65]